MSEARMFVNRESGVPLHRQVTSALQDAITCGTLAPGARILSSREYQRHLGVSRNTIVEALSHLHAEGYLVTVRGVGTFVADRVYGRANQQDDTTAAGAPYDALPFRPGLPALDLFPSAQLTRCIQAYQWTPGCDSDETGYPPLREAIAHRLQQTRGVSCSNDRIVVTNGAQAAFALIAAVLLKKGDAAFVEDPGYPDIRTVLHAAGARVVPVGVDRDGIDTAAFPTEQARLVYVTPSHQYPTGAVLSLQRRFALLDWANRNNAWVVEDDYGSAFDYTGHPQPSLQGLADFRGVMYVGTFSEILSPALRLAYVVVPDELKTAFAAALKVWGSAPSTLLQYALARFMNEGYLGRHIAKMRKVYNERRNFTCGHLAAAGRGIVRVQDTHAGLHVVADLPENVRDVDVSLRAKSDGLVVPPLSRYYSGATKRNGLLLGFAATPAPQARQALDTLVRIVKCASAAG